MKEKIFVTRPSLPTYEEYVEAIKPLWDSYWVTNMGKYHMQLEKELTEYLNVPMLSLIVNGHMALELVIHSFDFPEGSEIITTPFTFVSTTHAIVRNKLKPIFCDVKEVDGTIDESKIEELITPKTVAILPVHVYGNICNIEAIQNIAEKYKLKVIYDAAHAFGIKKIVGENKDNEIGIGNFGDTSIFSFHSTKVFNTVEGGGVACKNYEIYEKLYNLKNFGIHGEEEVVSVGANAKMNELCAIMGLCNLRHIDQAIQTRKQIYERYESKLQQVKGIRLFECRKDMTRNYAYMPIIITKDYKTDRDRLAKRLADENIYARKYFYPLTIDQICYKNRYVNYNIPVARMLSQNVLCLPIYENLAIEDVERVLQIL